MVLPEGNGTDFATEIKQRCQNLKIIYMSGYTNDIIVELGMSIQEQSFLQKPFSPIQLLEKIRSVLDE